MSEYTLTVEVETDRSELDMMDLLKQMVSLARIDDGNEIQGASLHVYRELGETAVTVSVPHLSVELE